MDTLRAELITKAKMREHNLDGWTFTWNNNTRRLGVCRHTTKTISLSQKYVAINGENEVMDTIMHEIAHALVGPGHGHDNVWKMMARKLGAKPRAATSEVISVPARFIAVCPNCGIQLPRHRRRKSACTACCNRYNGGQYSPSFLFKYYEAEDYAA